jgi:2-polyprenyl-3-methyl-5-hydroxy-6-metoxy-1,4-benzoquinol methylase
VLDVGCGGGKYLRFLRDRGYTVAGVEVNHEVVRRLQTEAGLEVYPGLITEAPIPDQSFDVVTLWWVLEHTHDPVGTLRAARRILKPGGTVVVALQNFAALGRVLFGAHWHHLDVPGHLYQFEPATLRSMLRHTGFTPLRVRHDLLAKDLAPSLGYWLGLRRSLDGALLNGLTIPLDLIAWGMRRSGLITAYAVVP